MSRSGLLFSALVATLVGVAAGIYLGLAKPPAPPAPLATTLPAGALTALFASRFDDSEGRTQSLAQWRGKTLVVNFWASWCPPCREEMPAFSRLQTRYSANGVQFVGIAVDSARNVVDFSSKHPVSYPLLVAERDGAELTRQLGNAALALPYTLVVSASGEVLMTRLGRLAEDELDALLARQVAPK